MKRAILSLMCPAIVLYQMAACTSIADTSPDTTSQWTLDEDLRIGSVDDPTTALAFVGTILVGEDGTIYARDSGEAPIRTFDVSGQPGRVIGRNGEGPGEFTNVSALGWLADSLYVLDSSLRRVSFFTAQGDFIGSSPIAAAAADPRPRFPDVLTVDGNGLLISTGNPRDPIVCWLSVDRDGIVLDTLHSFVRQDNEPIMLGGIILGRPAAPLEEPMYVGSADGRYLYLINREPAVSKVGAAFRINRISSSGDTLWSAAYPYDPIPIPEGEADSVYDAFVEMSAADNRPVSRSEVASNLSRLRPELEADFRLPVSDALVATQGDLWLRREALPDADSVSWDVISSAGVRQASVLMDAATTVRTVHADALYAMVRDSLNVPYIVRYTIQK